MSVDLDQSAEFVAAASLVADPDTKLLYLARAKNILKKIEIRANEQALALRAMEKSFARQGIQLELAKEPSE